MSPFPLLFKPQQHESLFAINLKKNNNNSKVTTKPIQKKKNDGFNEQLHPLLFFIHKFIVSHE